MNIYRRCAYRTDFDVAPIFAFNALSFVPRKTGKVFNLLKHFNRNNEHQSHPKPNGLPEDQRYAIVNNNSEALRKRKSRIGGF